MASRLSYGSSVLSGAFEQYTKDIQDEVKRIIIGTAQIIQTNAKALAAVDDGQLRDSIEIDVLNGGYSVKVNVGAEYAIYVEYGTGIYAVDGGGRTTPWTYYSDKLGRFVTTRGMEAQPFWEPAVDAGERYFLREMRRLGQ